MTFHDQGAPCKGQEVMHFSEQGCYEEEMYLLAPVLSATKQQWCRPTSVIPEHMQSRQVMGMIEGTGKPLLKETVVPPADAA